MGALGGEVERFRKAWIDVRGALREEAATDAGKLVEGHSELEALRAEVALLRRERDDLLNQVAQRDRVREYAVSGQRLVAQPTALHIVLGTQLRRLREARGISREAAGWEIRASELKISRMELGQVSFKERDVADLLTLYGVNDPHEREALSTLVRQSNYSGWWQCFRDPLPVWFEPFLNLEATASLIRSYEACFIPGLLQTADYAGEVIRLGHRGASRTEVDRLVQIRMARKQLLARRSSPRLWAIIDEVALWSPSVGRDIMRGQIAALIEAAMLPNVFIQITSSRSTAPTTFTILRFPDADLPDIVYMEHLTGALYIDDPDEVPEYLRAMDCLTIEAESPTRTVELLGMALRA